MEKNSDGNAWQIDEVIGADIVKKWILEGKIAEIPAGTYRQI
jgi:hypothetical protein